MEDPDLSPRRGLKRAEVLQLAQSEWVGHHLNLLILGPTGAGKTFLACSLGRAACQADFTVRYLRTSRLLQTLQLAHAGGYFPQLAQELARIHLLIFDDWLRDPLSRSQATDLLEILDDRHGLTATMIVTQLPVSAWLVPKGRLSDIACFRFACTERSPKRHRHPPETAIAFPGICTLLAGY